MVALDLNQNAIEGLRANMISLLTHRSVGIHFHFVLLDGQSLVGAGFPLPVAHGEPHITSSELRGQDPPLVRFSFMSLKESDLTSLELPDEQFLRQDRNARAQLVKLLIVPKLFQHRQDQIIVLDCCDMLFQDDVRLLWTQFESFGPHEVVGAVPEQIDTYQQNVSPWATPLPFPPSSKGGSDDLRLGFNSGVLLVRATAFVQSRFMERALEAVQRAGVAGQLSGPLQGDQDVFSLFAAQQPGLVHVLSCSWNVQLTTHSNRRHRPCHLRPSIYHANADTKLRLNGHRATILSDPRSTLFFLPGRQEPVLVTSSLDQFNGNNNSSFHRWIYGYALVNPAATDDWPPPRDAFKSFPAFRLPFSGARGSQQTQLRDAVEHIAKSGGDHFDAHQYLLAIDNNEEHQCSKAPAACRFTFNEFNENAEERLFAEMKFSGVVIQDFVSIGRYGHYASDRVAVIRRWQSSASGNQRRNFSLHVFGHYNLGAPYNVKDTATPPVCNDRWQMDLVHRQGATSTVLIRRTLTRFDTGNFVFDGLLPFYIGVPSFNTGDAIDLCIRVLHRDHTCKDGIRWPMSVIIKIYH